VIDPTWNISGRFAHRFDGCGRGGFGQRRLAHILLLAGVAGLIFVKQKGRGRRCPTCGDRHFDQSLND
jgi:hypothetical protein